jgi:tetratricopeptide (TPR) repeat protein
MPCLHGAAACGYRWTMRLACWLVLLCLSAWSDDWLKDVRQHGATLEAARQWGQAETVYQVALTRLGAQAPWQDRFWLLTSLIEVSFERGHYNCAPGWLYEAEKTVPEQPENAPERVRLLDAWGALHLVEGNLTAAERELSRSVALAPPDAPAEDLAALHNLAAVEMHMRRLAEATEHETKALAIWRQRFGETHYYVMKSWISLASLQGLRGDWPAAADNLRHALAIAESPEALANYAVVLDKLKRHREATEIRRHLPRLAAADAPLADVRKIRHDADQLNVRTR